MSLTLVFICAIAGLVDGLTIKVNETHPNGHAMYYDSIGPQIEIVKELCSNAPIGNTCTKIVKKCSFRHVQGSNVELCKCKDKVTGFSNIYDKWVLKGGMEFCSENKTNSLNQTSEPTLNSSASALVEKQLNFDDFLVNQNPTLVADFKCCFGTEIGLFDNNKSAVIAAWKESASGITHEAAMAAVNASIVSCAATVETCSPRQLMLCVVQGCYNTLTEGSRRNTNSTDRLPSLF